MINFSTLQGLTIPEGNVVEVMDASGRVLWSASKAVTIKYCEYSGNSQGMIKHNDIEYYEDQGVVGEFTANIGDIIHLYSPIPSGTWPAVIYVNNVEVASSYSTPVSYDYVVVGPAEIQTYCETGSMIYVYEQ